MKRRLVAFAVLLSVVPMGNGAGAFISGNIERTLVTEGAFGGCMALLDKTIRTETGLDCESRWVSFSCTGEFASKDIAYKMFDSAQMAMVLEYPVRLIIDDSRKHNGYCFAKRVEVFKE